MNAAQVRRSSRKQRLIGFLCLALAFTLTWIPSGRAAPMIQQPLDPRPPAQTVKLIFIHHSTGENWLRDDYGGLGRALMENNYFVSDTNYGWGPEAIGDRTDIPNWLEWFRSPNTPRYMEALFNESGQNSEYSRLPNDPGGENQIVLFKSCFPNSNLDGNPDDPPAPGEDYTVANAKYVYNEILQYFATRPDKLFVVITAPPVSDPTFAANARAFNLWLVNDWLRENNYPLNNVAVFDFYNVLTGRDHHHRLQDGQIEHRFTPGRNTLVYPSDDDHPSAAGSRKATEEFVPLLNAYYHRWQAGGAVAPPPIAPQPAVPQPVQPGQPAGVESGQAQGGDLLIDDFEGGGPEGSWGWESFWDESTPTSIDCLPSEAESYRGSRSLQIAYRIAAGAWAVCMANFEADQNWSAQSGIRLALRAEQAGQLFNIDLYTGREDARATWLYTVETPPESAGAWIILELAWQDFHRADWEENGGQPFTQPGEISGIGFGFPTYTGADNAGTIWVDDLQAFSAGAPLIAPPPAQETAPPVPTLAPPTSIPAEATPESGRRGCGLGLVLPLGLVGMATWRLLGRQRIKEVV